MGDILFHQVEFLGHQVVEFLLAWRSCTTLNAFFIELEASWNSWKFVGKKAVFDIQVLAQLLSSRLQNLRVGLAVTTPVGAGTRPSSHHGTPFLSWNVSHWNFEIHFFLLGDRQVTSPTRFKSSQQVMRLTVNPDLPRQVSPCLCPMAAIPRNDIGESGGGERWRFLERRKMEMLAQDIPHTLRKR